MTWHAQPRGYGAFACPAAGPEEARSRLLRLIEVMYVRHLAARVVQRARREAPARSSGLDDEVMRWCGGFGSFDEVWSSSLADLYAAAGGSGDPVRALAGFALTLGTHGRPGAWSASFSAPARLRWGTHLLPAATAVSARYGGGEARFDCSTEAGRSVAVRFDSRVPVDDAAAVCEPLPGPSDRDLPRLLHAGIVPPGCAPDERTRAALVLAVPSHAPALFEEAFDLLRGFAPEYERWVRRVVRDILVLTVSGDEMRSGSSPAWPGLLYMSLAKPIVLAENLVHEASHQYFSLLTRLEPADDGSDGRAYYSPVVGRERPLRAIALAHHAFANTALFLQACEGAGGPAGDYATARLAWLAPRLTALREPLVGNPALTAVGRALSEPLIERFDGIGSAGERSAVPSAGAVAAD